MKNNEFKIRTLTSCILLFLVFLIIFFDFALLYSLIILGILSLIEFLISLKNIQSKLFQDFLNIVFSFYIILFCFLFFFLTITFNLKLILFSLLFGCIASDIGGYILEKLFEVLN